MTQTEHFYAICCRLEIDNNVMSGRNVKTVEAYIVVNIGIATSSISFRHFPERLFCDDEVSDVNAIYSQPKVADDVTSCEDA